MAGLLGDFGEFLKTPEGQGLLSGAMGWAANARQGTPWNNMGRGGLAGIMGYSGALERQDKLAQEAEAKKLRDLQYQSSQMQIEEMKRKQADQEFERGLAAKYAKPATAAIPGIAQVPVNVANDQGPNLYSTSSSNMSTAGQAAVPAKPASFDWQGFIGELSARDALRAQELTAKLKPQTTTLKAGEAVYDSNGNLMFENHKEDSTDPKIKQYLYGLGLPPEQRKDFERTLTLGPALMAAAAAPLRNAQTQNIYDENAYNLPPPPRKPTAKPSLPMAGQVIQGYKFNGGDPADQRNWEKQ